YTATANASWLQGRHDVRFGIDTNRNHINHWQPPSTAGGARGGFTFSGGVTALKGGSSPNRFNSLADFMLGMPQAISKSLVGLATIREWVFGLYFRDRWQITPNLTATLGLRWEYYPLPTRDHRGIERYDPEDNKVYIGGIAGIPDNAGSEASKRGFAPRVGLAYRIRNAHVLRAGYGITIDPFSIGRSMRSNYPTVITGDWSGPNSYQPFATLARGIPALVFPDISTGVLDMPEDVEANFIAKGVFRRGYIQSWNLIYEAQLPWSFVGSAGYVATRSIRQRTSLELNSAPPGGGNAGRAMYLKFGRTASTEEHAAWQTSQYDSLQASLDRRFKGGLMVKTAYTWSKAMGYNDNSNDRPFFLYPAAWHRNRALQGFDRTHVFRTAWMWNLPFGTNQKWGHGAVANALLGGWQVNGIFSSYTGTPFTVTSSGASLNAPGNSQVADQVKANVAKLGGIGNNNPWLDPLAFRAVTEVRFGNSGRNMLRGPGVVNLDMGLFRRFKLTERTDLQFRAEAFNITNTPHFNNPSSNASNMSLNPDGSLKSSGSFMAILSAAQDQRSFRFGLRFSF
ncbi:MAG: TonB-dependent receptor, partial [Acidobacteria bacterium]|nr:TonB-dependent receptor [Acidobacteriota bacterium]